MATIQEMQPTRISFSHQLLVFRSIHEGSGLSHRPIAVTSDDDGADATSTVSTVERRRRQPRRLDGDDTTVALSVAKNHTPSLAQHHRTSNEGPSHTLQDVLELLDIFDPLAADQRRPASEMSQRQLDFLLPSLEPLQQDKAYAALGKPIRGGTICARHKALEPKAFRVKFAVDQPPSACKDCAQTDQVCILSYRGDSKPLIVPRSALPKGDRDMADPLTWLSCEGP